LIPSIIVFVLTIYSFDVLVDITEAKEDEFKIEVTAQRFFWEFRYPNDEYELISNHVLVVPENETIRLEMTSQDVIHSFWVPDFRAKQDVMPGRTSELRFTPTDWTGLPADFELLTLEDLDVPGPDTACPVEGEEPAEETTEEPLVSTISTEAGSGGERPPVDDENGYDLVCAELCGASHGLMRGEVYVVTREEYDAYIETLKAKVIASEAQTAYAVRCGGEQIKTVGRELFQKFGCNTCHTLADVGSTAVTGPNLNEIAVRAATYPGFATPADYIRTSILNPNATIAEGFPANIMPSNFADRIDPDELELLVAYLGLQTGQ
jgi:cytochrome c oxidase subunit 2